MEDTIWTELILFNLLFSISDIVKLFGSGNLIQSLSLLDMDINETEEQFESIDNGEISLNHVRIHLMVIF